MVIARLVAASLLAARAPMLAMNGGGGGAETELRGRLADAQNAEARLRNMVRTANDNAQRLADERDEALAELDAVRTLAEDEAEALREQVDELELRLAHDEVPPPNDAELAARVEAMAAELHAARARSNELEDERDELRAQLTLLGEEHERDLDAHSDTVAQLEEQLQRALRSGGDASSAADTRERLLEEQVAELIRITEIQSDGLLELGQLRPKAAMADKYERLLREAGLLESIAAPPIQDPFSALGLQSEGA